MYVKGRSSHTPPSSSYQPTRLLAMQLTTSYFAMLLSYAVAQQSSTSAASCPMPGERDSQGRYGCNPAHQYPNSQTCKRFDNCYYLFDGSSSIIIASSTSSPTPTPSCPLQGEKDSKGRYSCNPAHQYPNGQTCKQLDGCYYLYQGSSVIIASSAASPTPTPLCPAEGTTDSEGRYICNPSHQYPDGQTCKVLGDCPYLYKGSSLVIASSTPSPS